VNAIRDLHLARGWKPYLKTPFFPSYPSGHATYSAAAAEVLAHLFPDRAREFRAKAREAAMSRLYGGIHFRIDNDTGLRVGAGVGRLVVRRAETDGAER
jgi:membrane-associated phospholipid phosphatase